MNLHEALFAALIARGARIDTPSSSMTLYDEATRLHNAYEACMKERRAQWEAGVDVGKDAAK